MKLCYWYILRSRKRYSYPQKIVTGPPSIIPIAIVVEIPNGTAIIAKLTIKGEGRSSMVI
jgi:hypothetical protein